MIVSRRRPPEKTSPRPSPRARQPGAPVAPDRRFCDAAADPQRQQRRQHADEEDPPPAPARQDEAGDGGRGAVADRPGALHQAERLAAIARAPRFGDQRRAARPLAAHAEAQADAAERQLPHGLGEAAEEREHRVDEDAPDQRPRPSEAIGDDAEADAAGGGGEQGDRSEQPRGGRRQREVAHQVGEDQRPQHHVERIEHPAEPGGDEGAPSFGGAVAPPAEEAGGRGSRVRAHSALPVIGGLP